MFFNVYFGKVLLNTWTVFCMHCSSVEWLLVLGSLSINRSEGTIISTAAPTGCLLKHVISARGRWLLPLMQNISRSTIPRERIIPLLFSLSFAAQHFVRKIAFSFSFALSWILFESDLVILFLWTYCDYFCEDSVPQIKQSFL